MSTPGQISGSHLSTGCPAQQMASPAQFLKLLGHCLKIIPFRLEHSGSLLPHRHGNINQGHMSLRIYTLAIVED